jgi:hypothetical protein
MKQLPLSRAVTTLVNSIVHFHMEEQFINQSIKTDIAATNSRHETDTETATAELISLRTDWLQSNVIFDPIHGDVAAISCPDMPCFSLEQWHFFLAARIYAAQALYFTSGMKRESLKIMGKVLQCPLLVMDTSGTCLDSVTVEEGTTPSAPASASAPAPLLAPSASHPALIRESLSRRVWKLRLEMRYDQQVAKAPKTTDAVAYTPIPHESCDLVGVDASSDDDILYIATLRAVLACGTDDPELLLVLASAVRRLPMCPNRYRQVTALLELHVTKIVTFFDTERTVYMKTARADDNIRSSRSCDEPINR